MNAERIPKKTVNMKMVGEHSRGRQGQDGNSRLENMLHQGNKVRRTCSCGKREVGRLDCQTAYRSGNILVRSVSK
jgi:hypothetical protein